MYKTFYLESLPRTDCVEIAPRYRNFHARTLVSYYVRCYIAVSSLNNFAIPELIKCFSTVVLVERP